MPVRRLLRAIHQRAIMGRRVERLAELLAERLPQGARVLDVGAGSGEIAAAILRRRPDLSIEGIDVLIRPVTLIPVRRYDGLRMPFADATFDACVFVDVLHHCDDPLAVLREARRVSRGLVVVKDHFSRSALDRRTLQFMDWVGNWGHGVGLPFRYFHADGWARQIGEAGLRETARASALGLYGAVLEPFFGRGLHFLSVLDGRA